MGKSAVVQRIKGEQTTGYALERVPGDKRIGT